MENEKFQVSVSSAKSFADCNMQWFIGSVLKIRKPDTPATKIGTVFAEFCEAYVKNDFKKIDEIYSNEENTTVRMLYDKNTKFFLELKDSVKEAEFELNFGMNLYIRYSGWIDALLEDENSIIVRDYKTAKDWTYTLTEKTMGADEQLNIYGYFVNTYYNPKKKPIWLEHQQFHKGTGMRKEVRVPYNHEEGKAIYDWLVEQAESMVEVKRLKIEQVNKNFDSCGKFGGCPYTNYCKGKINLKELEEVLNPNIKERTREQLIEMKPEERLEELKKEKAFNDKGNEILTKIKGEENMGLSIKDKLLALKAKQEEAKKQSAFPEPEKKEEVLPGKEEPVKNTGTVTVTVETDIKTTSTVSDNPLLKKRTRRTKAEMEASLNNQLEKDAVTCMVTEMRAPVSSDALVKEIQERNKVLQNAVETKEQVVLQPVQPDGVPVVATVSKTKQVLVLVGCAFLEEDKNNPSDFLHDKYVAPILKQENIPHISCSEFSKANKSLMLFAQSILDEIYNGYDSINIDIRRPVDALVYTMIMDLDTRKNGKRFKLIRSTF